MRVVVIGDVSWRGNYHLGDEAMTEVAIAELTRRGIAVTLLAGDPGISAAHYGVDTAPQFGYRAKPGLAQRERHLETVLAAARGDAEAPAGAVETIDAVAQADAIVIAGGGNLNSLGQHHIFERVTLKRLAELRGIPLYVTSQTVGPHLVDGDRELVAEIAAYARVFGARERGTRALVDQITSGNANVVATLDDAILLEQQAPSADLDLPDRYIVGSFTFHSKTTGLTRTEYYRRLAHLLDDIALRLDFDIVLLPHMGRLEADLDLGVEDDTFGHDRIAEFSASGRIRSVPMISARELLGVTAGAEFTISTRYHPVVFGAAVGVPAVGLVTSYYSASRMRGALANIGMEAFAIPFETWEPLFGARVLAALETDRAAIRTHTEQAGRTQLAFQTAWWDGIVADLIGSGALALDDLPDTGDCSWGSDADAEALAAARVAQESTNLIRLNISFPEEELPQRLEQIHRELRDLHLLRDEVRELREANARQREALADLRHRARPPGAALRDRLNAKLRRRS